VTDASDDELIAFLRDRLAGYKIPRAIERCAIDELPIGSSGKPLRRAARALFIARRDSSR
jgi:fatty-acyl-CoA synthase